MTDRYRPHRPDAGAASLARAAPNAPHLALRTADEQGRSSPRGAVSSEGNQSVDWFRRNTYGFSPGPKSTNAGVRILTTTRSSSRCCGPVGPVKLRVFRGAMSISPMRACTCVAHSRPWVRPARRHYEQWVPQAGESELRRFEAYEPVLA
jgi:hypothetical protein